MNRPPKPSWRVTVLKQSNMPLYCVVPVAPLCSCSRTCTRPAHGQHTVSSRQLTASTQPAADIPAHRPGGHQNGRARGGCDEAFRPAQAVRGRGTGAAGDSNARDTCTRARAPPHADADADADTGTTQRGTTTPRTQGHTGHTLAVSMGYVMLSAMIDPTDEAAKRIAASCDMLPVLPPPPLPPLPLPMDCCWAQTQSAC